MNRYQDAVKQDLWTLLRIPLSKCDADEEVENFFKKYDVTPKVKPAPAPDDLVELIFIHVPQYSQSESTALSTTIREKYPKMQTREQWYAEDERDKNNIVRLERELAEAKKANEKIDGENFVLRDRMIAIQEITELKYD